MRSWFLGFLEWRAGNWEVADRYANDSMELATQLGRLSPPGELPSAVIAAHRGRIGDARARAQGAIARAEAEGIRIAQSGHSWVLGFVELSLGDAAAALAYLGAPTSFAMASCSSRECAWSSAICSKH